MAEGTSPGSLGVGFGELCTGFRMLILGSLGVPGSASTPLGPGPWACRLWAVAPTATPLVLSPTHSRLLSRAAGDDAQPAIAVADAGVAGVVVACPLVASLWLVAL